MHWEIVAEDSQLASFVGNPEWHGNKDDSSGNGSAVWSAMNQSGMKEKPLVETSIVEKQAWA